MPSLVKIGPQEVSTPPVDCFWGFLAIFGKSGVIIFADNSARRKDRGLISGMQGKQSPGNPNLASASPGGSLARSQFFISPYQLLSVSS